MELTRLLTTQFTEERVHAFLSDTLDFPDWEVVLAQDKLQFLTLLLRQHMTHVYFQNIRMSSVPPESRAPPSIEQVVAVGFGGRGGVCFELNYFLHLLLLALGFDAGVVGGTMLNGLRGAHVMVLVRLKDPGEGAESEACYLLDAASANPLEVPVPLHQLPHKMMAGGCVYEFRVLEAPSTATHGRFQIGGAFLRPPSDIDIDGRAAGPDSVLQSLRCEFDLSRRNFVDFQATAEQICTNPGSRFLKCPLLFRYLDPYRWGRDLNGNLSRPILSCAEYDDSDSLDSARCDSDDWDWVLICGFKCVLANKTRRKVRTYATYDKLQPFIRKYFPKLGSEEIRLAMQQFEQAQGDEQSFLNL